LNVNTLLTIRACLRWCTQAPHTQLPVESIASVSPTYPGEMLHNTLLIAWEFALISFQDLSTLIQRIPNSLKHFRLVYRTTNNKSLNRSDGWSRQLKNVADRSPVSLIVSPLREPVMRPLRYSINVTLDGCVDHRAGSTDEELHRFWAEKLAQADALLFGRVTYEMMQAAWRWPANGLRPEWMAEWMEPFARTIDAAKKYVVSSTLDRVDWNTELLLGEQGRGDLGQAVQQLKREPGNGLFVGGVTLPLALAELELIDEYEFVVHPRLAGHGPTLFAGLSKYVDLKLVSRWEFDSGAVAMRYEPRR